MRSVGESDRSRIAGYNLLGAHAHKNGQGW